MIKISVVIFLSLFSCSILPLILSPDSAPAQLGMAVRSALTNERASAARRRCACVLIFACVRARVADCPSTIKHRPVLTRSASLQAGNTCAIKARAAPVCCALVRFAQACEHTHLVSHARARDARARAREGIEARTRASPLRPLYTALTRPAAWQGYAPSSLSELAPVVRDGRPSAVLLIPVSACTLLPPSLPPTHPPVSYTQLTLPPRGSKCRSRWGPYH